MSERLSEIGVQSVQSKPVLSVIRAIWLLLKTQFYVVIMLLPLTQMMGADFTLLTFLWNMMLIPLFSVVVIPSLVLAGLVQWIFLGAADSLSMFLAHAVAQFLVGLLNAISEFGDHWSDWFYDLPLSLELIPQGIILYPFILLFLLPVYRYLRLFGFAMFSVLILVRSEQKSALEVWFLDVGQALSVVMIKDNRALVYDTGFVVGKFNAFDAVIEPFLRLKQVEAVDVLIVSHDDSDHSGGLDAFMESDYKPNSLITTFAVKPSYEKSVLCDSRLNFAWQGDVQVIALWPVNHDMGVGLVHGELQSDNDSSCVVSITYNDNKVLLTGDISKRVEKRLVNSEAVMSGNLDVLSVSHHGSKTSSSELFLKSVNPNYAVISSGPLNRFRHPHESVLNRLRSYSSQVFNTGVDGAVGFIWRDDQSSFDVLLPFNENQPYWKVKRTEQ